MDQDTLRSLVAYGGGALGAILGFAREIRRWRQSKERLSALRAAPPTESEAAQAILVFRHRHRRYRAAEIAFIVGLALFGGAAIPGDFGILAVFGVPLMPGGLVLGIESYKCPRCGEAPMKSWSPRAPSYPQACSQCGVALRM